MYIAYVIHLCNHTYTQSLYMYSFMHTHMHLCVQPLIHYTQPMFSLCSTPHHTMPHHAMLTTKHGGCTMLSKCHSYSWWVLCVGWIYYLHELLLWLEKSYIVYVGFLSYIPLLWTLQQWKWFCQTGWKHSLTVHTNMSFTMER